MKTRYRFIHFVEEGRQGVWACRNNKSGDRIGVVLFYQPLKQWVWQQPVLWSRFDDDCLLDIAHFMNQLKKP